MRPATISRILMLLGAETACQAQWLNASDKVFGHLHRPLNPETFPGLALELQ